MDFAFFALKSVLEGSWVKMVQNGIKKPFSKFYEEKDFFWKKVELRIFPASRSDSRPFLSIQPEAKLMRIKNYPPRNFSCLQTDLDEKIDLNRTYHKLAETRFAALFIE